jgi:Fe-S cluster assembly scaffold protein SufB
MSEHRRARPALPRPVTAVSEPGNASAAAPSGNGATPAKVKAGRHREATLYQALAGAGAGDGRSLEQLRADALAAFQAFEPPVWRRSGFWTTSLQSLDPDLLSEQRQAPDAGATAGIPEVVGRTLPDRPRAGRIVQSADAVVQIELDPALAERGVILCSLEEAFREHGELVAPWYSRRLTIDRHKLEAANAAFWRGGAFLYVPPGLVVEAPFEIV